MNKQIFISLIDKFLSNRASEEEIEALVNYYQSFRQSGEWDVKMLGDAKEMEQRLLTRLQTAVAAEETEPVKKAASKKSWHKWGVAASIAGILVIAGYSVKGILTNWLNPVKMVEVNTAKGMRQQIQLPDGTRIWLEGNSSFSYPSEFKGDRIVCLSGEAFFEVAADEVHPFIINTPLISTKVLGTSFNIEAYGEKQAEVVVVTGKVIVQAADEEEHKATGKSLILTRNQKVTYDTSIKTFNVKEAPEALDYQQRKNGRFIYKGASVGDIIKDLQRAYDTPIAIRKAMLDCTFYGDFNTAESVEKALNLIAITLNATVEKQPDGKGYTISGGGCH